MGQSAIALVTLTHSQSLETIHAVLSSKRKFKVSKRELLPSLNKNSFH